MRRVGTCAPTMRSLYHSDIGCGSIWCSNSNIAGVPLVGKSKGRVFFLALAGGAFLSASLVSGAIEYIKNPPEAPLSKEKLKPLIVCTPCTKQDQVI